MKLEEKIIQLEQRIQELERRLNQMPEANKYVPPVGPWWEIKPSTAPWQPPFVVTC